MPKRDILVHTDSSFVADKCQISGSTELESILFLGYLPPVNQLIRIGEHPKEQPSFPAELLYCEKSYLAQLGLIVNSKILFPPEYPYTSSTTKILRDNFCELYDEITSLYDLDENDLVIDIGSNDGNLLSNFQHKHKILGITPEKIGHTAIKNGIPTIIDYFSRDVVNNILINYGKAKIITATNVFAHIDNINEVVNMIDDLLMADGIFISESHYLVSLINNLQYDTIYHEHLRYYSLNSLNYLFEKHNLEIINAKKIPTHGGSIRVYAARKGVFSINNNVKIILDEELEELSMDKFKKFRDRVILSKLKLYGYLLDIKKAGCKIYGIGAPSRATTLINYVGIDSGIVDCVLEIPGSQKIGHYIPGTKIPILDENILFEDQPEFALILSWHIADELISKLDKKGFSGKYIIPLPEPTVI